MIRLLHDSRSAAYRSPTGAQTAHSAVPLRLLAEGASFFSLRLVYRGEELTAAALNGVPMDL